MAFGHRAVAHECKIRKGSLIGIGAIVLNGAEIGEESIIGAGLVVTPKVLSLQGFLPWEIRQNQSRLLMKKISTYPTDDPEIPSLRL